MSRAMTSDVETQVGAGFDAMSAGEWSRARDAVSLNPLLTPPSFLLELARTRPGRFGTYFSHPARHEIEQDLHIWGRPDRRNHHR